MQLKNGRSSGTAVMVFSGEYDLASKDQVRSAFDAVLDAPRLALDFSDVTYIDSTIIHELIRVHNARAAADLERETVVMRNSSLLRLFEILHLRSVFRVVDSLDEAIDKNGEDITVQYASAFNGAASVNGAIKGATA
ncbi:MAG: STAS domain-containing protein [Candidatus Cybelea sp.]|jgi:anti-anti-sigma factor